MSMVNFAFVFVLQGILGVIQLPLGSALIVISKKTRLGEVDGNIIFRMDAVDIYPLNFRVTGEDSKCKSYLIIFF